MMTGRDEKKVIPLVLLQQICAAPNSCVQRVRHRRMYKKQPNVIRVYKPLLQNGCTNSGVGAAYNLCDVHGPALTLPPQEDHA